MLFTKKCSQRSNQTQLLTVIHIVLCCTIQNQIISMSLLLSQKIVDHKSFFSSSCSNIFLLYNSDVFGYYPKQDFWISVGGFSSFFAIFDDFSKFCSAFSTLHFEKSSNLAKKVEKPCSTCFLHGRYPISGCRVPIPPLICRTQLIFHIDGNKSIHYQ